MFSSFSFLQREAKLVAGQAERADYYNLDADSTLGDLTKEKALRWDVLPLGVDRDDELDACTCRRRQIVSERAPTVPARQMSRSGLRRLEFGQQLELGISD